MGDWQNITVVGEPVAYGIGFLVLVVVAFTGGLAATIVRVAHEGGHMLGALITGNRVVGFELEDGDETTGSGGTYYQGGARGFLSEVVNKFAGYATPPLTGLGGAYVVADGNAWGVLLIGVVLLLAVLLIPEINPFALLITGLLLVGIVWAIIAGGPGVQAALAVGLVWLLLIGGLRTVLVRNVRSDDVKKLAANTVIPRAVWFAGWLAIAVASLWVGGRVLLGYA